MINLPQVERIQLHTESDFYGARHIAARYCGLSTPSKPIRGIWQHGVILDFRIVHPYIALGSMDASNKDMYFWVSKKSQEDYLKKNSYRNVKAIGLPIIYLPESNFERIPNSLLVMPVHSLDYTTHKHWKFAEYAGQINEIKHHFSQVTICIHSSCVKKGYWVNEFKGLGFRIVEGVQLNDRNDLLRLQTLMSSFEFVTTNGIGSHIPYAAYFGAKPSIYGSFAHFRVEDHQNTPFYNKFPEVIEWAVQSSENSSEESIRRHLPDLFCHPSEAKQKLDWGRYEVGVENKVSPGEMMEVFEWGLRHRLTYRVKQEMQKYNRGLRSTAKKMLNLLKSTVPSH